MYIRIYIYICRDHDQQVTTYSTSIVLLLGWFETSDNYSAFDFHSDANHMVEKKQTKNASPKAAVAFYKTACYKGGSYITQHNAIGNQSHVLKVSNALENLASNQPSTWPLTKNSFDGTSVGPPDEKPRELTGPNSWWIPEPKCHLFYLGSHVSRSDYLPAHGRNNRNQMQNTYCLLWL